MLLWALLAVAQGFSAYSAEAPASQLRCEFLQTPLGIEDSNPGLSWTVSDERRGVEQKAYRVLVASSQELLVQQKGDLWDSGEIASNKSHLVAYAGKPLVSRQRCYWKVQVKLSSAEDSKITTLWTEPSWWEMGLLKPEDWKGSWIQSPACKPVSDEITKLWTRNALIPQELNHPVIKKKPELAKPAHEEGERLMASVLPVPVFRSSFEVAGTIKRARLYLSGLGFAEAYVNGAPVSDRMFDPSTSFYKGRGGYVTHDITQLVRSGSNVVTAIVGGGWWNESIVWGSPDRVMGLPSLRAQVEIELADGTRLTVPTSAKWTTAIGPILKSHYYAGEVFDARRAPGWKSGADDGLQWAAATEVPAPVPLLFAQKCEPERIVERVKPVAVTQPRPGIWVFDLGRIVMGTVELNTDVPAGTALVMRTAEWTWQPSRQGEDFKPTFLHYDTGDNAVRTEGMIVGKARGSGYFTFSFEPKDVKEKMRQVQLGVPTLLYVARGGGETWHPRFNMHAFRYIEVQGLKEKPPLSLVTGLIITNDEEQAGKFSSGNPRFNDIFEACMNSTRFTTHGMAWDNGVERLQAQVYNSWSAPFASYMLWYPNLWRKLLEDQRLENVLAKDRQSFAGTIYGSRNASGPPRNPITQGVTVELPMAYYDRYGDLRELEKHYPHMKAFCEAFIPKPDGKLSEQADPGGWTDHFYREACADSPWTPEWDPKALMSMTIYGYFRDTADAARALGKPEEAAALEKTAAAIRDEINRTWYDAANKTYGAAKSNAEKTTDPSKGWHGLMAMAITTGVAPKEDVPKLLENCIADMKAHYNSHHAAGHIMHQLLYDAYSDNGLIESCYDMMNSTGFPSFAYQLRSGNRTIPEGPTWSDSLPAKASAYQNECQEPARWFTQTLCGISPDRAQAGFKNILLHPRIPSRLPSASLATTTPYGQVESSWKQKDGTVTWTVKIPANSHATAWIPAKGPEQVKESGRALGAALGCHVIGSSKQEGLECQLGSGLYHFEFPSPANTPSRLSELH